MNRNYTMLALAAFAALGLAAPSAEAQSYTLNTLATFNSSVNGADPQAGLTLSGTTLYGTTSSGGPSGGGTVFSLSTSGGTPTVLASFDSTVGTSATSPESSLLLVGTKLYGTTFGVAGVDDASTLGGTVFSVPVAGGGATTVANFNANGNGQFANGANSSAGLVLSGTTLFGTTSGGGSSDAGTVFSIPDTAIGATPTTLLNFAFSNGATPNSGLTLSGTTLYGTTFFGGANGDGSVFSVSTTGTAPTTLASFSSTTGENPYGGLTLVGSTFYGTTEFGGTGTDGTLFSVPLAGGTPTTLFNFTGPADGANPVSGLTLSGSTLYGTTSSGGANNDGTVFSFNITTATFTTLATFNNTNGATPLGGITVGANGVLYGMTSGGGSGDGIVFSLTPIAAPEPSPWAVFGLGALGLFALRLRARRAFFLAARMTDSF